MLDNDSVLQTAFNVSVTPESGSQSGGVSHHFDNIRMPNTNTKIVYGTVAALGILGNLIVIVVISKSSKMRKTFANILILNQSCIDFIASLLVILSTTTRTSVRDLSGISGDLFCKLWLSDLPLWALLTASSYALLVLTVERYVAIVHPIFHHNVVSKRKVYLLAGSAWLTGPIVIMCLLIPTSGVIGCRCRVLSIFPSDVWKGFCGVMMFVCAYLIPMSVYITCYSKIFLCIRNRVVPQTEVVSNEAVSQKARSRRNVLKTLVIIVVCYIICNSWNQFTFLFFNLGYQVDFSSAFYHFTVIATFANSCINPIIYALQYETFQKEFRKVFLKCGSDTPVVAIG